MREFVYWTRDRGNLEYAGLGNAGCLNGSFDRHTGLIVREYARGGVRQALTGNPYRRCDKLVMIHQPKP